MPYGSRVYCHPWRRESVGCPRLGLFFASCYSPFFVSFVSSRFFLSGAACFLEAFLFVEQERY